MTALFQRACIIGVGLIGGSLARGAKQHGLIGHISGFGRRESHLRQAYELGVVDTFSTSIEDAVAECDLIVLATPLCSMPLILEQLKTLVSEDVVITDVGSAKRSVIQAVKNAYGKLPENFVAGHPIAGTEKSGVEASFAELYQNRCVILTPDNSTNPDAVQKIQTLWEGVGAEVVMMTAAHHDEVLAATSHVPHVLAFTLVDTLAKMQEHSEIFRFAAGGFRDFTRIASSDPEMWRDISIENSDAILTVLRRFQQSMDELCSAIEQQDGDQIETIYRRAKLARDQHITV